MCLRRHAARDMQCNTHTQTDATNTTHSTRGCHTRHTCHFTRHTRHTCHTRQSMTYTMQHCNNRHVSTQHEAAIYIQLKKHASMCVYIHLAIPQYISASMQRMEAHAQHTCNNSCMRKNIPATKGIHTTHADMCDIYVR